VAELLPHECGAVVVKFLETKKGSLVVGHYKRVCLAHGDLSMVYG